MAARTSLDICAEQYYGSLRQSVCRILQTPNTFVPRPEGEIIILSGYERKQIIAAGGSPERYARTATPFRVALEVAGFAGLIASELSYDLPPNLTNPDRLKADTASAMPSGDDNIANGDMVALALNFLYVNQQLGNLANVARRGIDPLNRWPYLFDLSAAASFQLIEQANNPQTN
ncbi:MAG: hypothetical protein WBP26_01430 [Candidatus Saccharimonadales bacterium]